MHEQATEHRSILELPPRPTASDELPPRQPYTHTHTQSWAILQVNQGWSCPHGKSTAQLHISMSSSPAGYACPPHQTQPCSRTAPPSITHPRDVATNHSTHHSTNTCSSHRPVLASDHRSRAPDNASVPQRQCRACSRIPRDPRTQTTANAQA